jgi:hypothetical protein
MEQGTVRVEHGTLLRDLPAGGAEVIADSPAVNVEEQVALEALDSAALSEGTD